MNGVHQHGNLAIVSDPTLKCSYTMGGMYLSYSTVNLLLYLNLLVHKYNKANFTPLITFRPSDSFPKIALSIIVVIAMCASHLWFNFTVRSEGD